MDIWDIKRLSMRNARFCAVNAFLLLGLLLWCLAIRDYLFAAINAVSLGVDVWAGVKLYRRAVARI
jgi:hypothetical protein